MTDDTPSSNNLANRGHQPNALNKGYQPTMANDGHQPRPTPGPSVAPGKVQGGYQAPSGGKPAAPTTGSGVKR
jgi:hypothetical protein